MSVGVGFELGAKGGAGVTVAGSLGRGKANGQDLSWDETKITAGREVALSSGSDTQLNGAVVTAPKVSATVGGDLAIASLQDTSTYRNKQQSVGGSITFGPKVTGSVNVANSNIKSDYASVDQQAGIRAGDNGFQVNVQGDTTLTGGAITSTDKATKENKNSFTTGGQLTTSDINNQANYQADSVGVNLGVGVSPLGKYIPGGTSAGIGSDSGKSSSTTRAGISDIAGDKTARTDANNSNQANTSVALAKIFDADKVQKEINAQVAIKLSGLYDKQENATRDRSYLVKKAQDITLLNNGVLIGKPEKWTAISVLLKEAR
jgi:filamentous hemagglutinin